MKTVKSFLIPLLLVVLVVGCSDMSNPVASNPTTDLSSGSDNGNSVANGSKGLAGTAGFRNPERYNLWAGQHTLAGYVWVSNDEDEISVSIETIDGWSVNVSHLWAGVNITTLPANKKGIPVIGHFPYRLNQSPFEFSIPVNYNRQTDLFIALQAEVARVSGVDRNGNEIIEHEGAWAGDIPGYGPRWWFYLGYTFEIERDPFQEPGFPE